MDELGVGFLTKVNYQQLLASSKKYKLDITSRDRLKQMGLTFQLDDTEQMLMPFDHFNQASMKSKYMRMEKSN
nr:hypothetical protein BaRGS_007523 [Batillaria attramentaria]